MNVMGMQDQGWHRDWRIHNNLRDAAVYAENQSQDPSTRTGCILVSADGRHRAYGTNKMPPGTPDTVWHDREAKYARVVHAEIDALTHSRFHARGATVYMHPWMPCERCAAALASAGVAKVVAQKPDAEREARWSSSFILARQIFKDAGVELVEVE